MLSNVENMREVSPRWAVAAKGCLTAGALGIDIGGVIVLRVNDGSETSLFGDRFLENQPIAGAFEGIRQLVISASVRTCT